MLLYPFRIITIIKGVRVKHGTGSYLENVIFVLKSLMFYNNDRQYLYRQIFTKKNMIHETMNIKVHEERLKRLL